MASAWDFYDRFIKKPQLFLRMRTEPGAGALLRLR
jgi:hypothetical protein